MTGETWTLQTLLDSMAGHGDRLAVVAYRDAGRDVCSFADLARRARTLAAGLVADDAQPGERVYLCAAGGIDWITAYLGALGAGLVVAPLDHLSAADELARVAAIAPAHRVFADSGTLDRMRGVVPSARFYRLGGPTDDGEKAGADVHWRDLRDNGDAELPEIDPAAPALLLQTSGTTGAPKLFTLTMCNLAANIVPLVDTGLAGAQDRLVLPLPLHHVYPQVVGLLAALAAGTTIVLPAAVTAAALRDALHGERATGIVGVPRLYEGLLDGLDEAIHTRGQIALGAYRSLLLLSVAARRRLGWNLGRYVFGSIRRHLAPGLRLLISGGARLDPAVAWKLAGLGFDIRSGYGLAETASTHTANVPGSTRLGTEGRPFQGGEVRIDAPNDESIGEIVLRGPNVFGGYLDPMRNRDAFTSDGWFRTGDLGHLDGDGFLTVTGRVKETIVLGGGKKIDPEHLEKRYAASSFVAEIAVFEQEGRLVALIRPDAAAISAAGHVRAQGAVRAALGEISSELSSHERLSGFALVREALPRTRLGKLRRFLLPDLYRQALADEADGVPKPAVPSSPDKTLLAQPRVVEAWRLMQERYRTRLRSADDYLALDLGIDSLEWLNLVATLEDRFAIDLSDGDLGDIATVRGLLMAVARAPASRERAVAGASAAPPAGAERWMGPVAPWQRALARRLLGLDRLLIRSLFGLRVDGLDHLPRQGAFVIACNHLSYLDAPTIIAALPPEIRNRTHWGAAEERLPAARSLHWLWVALNVFPLAEATPAVGLACARDALARGGAMAMFPEAWRSADGTLQAFMPGIGLIVDGTEIPVVPARLSGTFEALPRFRRWPRLRPLGIRFGAPRLPGELAASGHGDTPVERIANALREAVAALDESSGQ